MLIGIEAERANAPQKTGVEHYAKELILQFARKDQENEYILYLRTKPEEWIKALPKNFIYKVMPFPIFWTQLRLSWEMLIHPPDVLFIPASAIPIFSPKKSVCTIHDAAFLFYPESFTWFQRNFLHFSYKYIAWKASKIIAVSKATKDDLIKYYRIPEEKIQVVHHGYTPLGGKHEILNPKHDLSAEVINGTKEETNSNNQISNTDDKEEEEEEERKGGNDNYNYNQTVIPEAMSESASEGYLESSTGLNLEPSTLKLPPRFVLFLSTLQPRKNLEGLIDALKLFRQKHPLENVQLVVAGRVGWKAEKILEKIKDSQDFVVYLNHVTDQQRAELYQKAEAFCVPSFYEGFGMWILEAFDSGVPVITSNVSSMPEVAGEGAEYCDPHSVLSITQALENVLQSPQRKTQLRELGFQRLQNFSWEKCATKTLSQILS